MAFPTIGLAAIMDVKDFAKGEKVYTSGLDKMNKGTESVSKRLTGALGTVTKAALGVGVAAGGAIAALGVGLFKLAAEAAPLPAIAQSFTALGGSIEDLRAGSVGLITDVELMKSFNTAASLVSKDFAQKLPAAMEALGKVAASTGQDMGFLLNSLTTGVGRLSPMILDNLAIQVDLTAAYEDFAEANGTTVKAMTKTEQQTALMSQVMAKLNANTEALPDVLGTASQRLGSLSVMLKNLTSDIGVAFLPVLQEVLVPLSALAARIGPQVVEWVQRLATQITTKIIPAVKLFATRVMTEFVPAIMRFVDMVRFDIIPVVTAFVKQMVEAVRTGNWALIGQWIGTQLQKAVAIATEWFRTNVVPAANKLGEQIREWATKAAAWVSANAGPMLEKLRATLGDWIDKAVQWFVDNVVPIANELGEKVRAWVVAAAAWVSANAGPIATEIQKTLGDWIDKAVAWFQENIVPIANELGAKVRAWISGAVTWVKDNAGPLVTKAGETLTEWAAKVVTWFNDNVVPKAQELGGKIRAWIEAAIEWTGTKAQELGDELGVIVLDVTDKANTWFEENAAPAVTALGETIASAVTDAISQAEEMLPEASVSFGTSLVKFISDADLAVNAQLPTIGAKIGETLGNIVRTAIGFFAGSGTFTQMRDEMFLNIWQGIIAGSAENPNLITAGFNALVTAVTSMWTAFIDAVTGDTTFSTKLGDWISGVVTTTVTGIKDGLKLIWFGLGENTILGLLEGMVKVWDDVLAPALEKLTDNLPQLVKDILKIASGSKAFAEIGFDTMLGFAEGIDEGQAQVIKKLSKAVGRIVNAFKQLVELQLDFDLRGGKFPDINNFLDQFESAITEVLNRLDSIIEQVGEKRIKKIRKSAKRLREILDAVMIDLSKIATATLPDLGRWRDQVIDVTRAVLEVLGHLAFEFGAQAIEDAAVWAGAVADLLAIVQPGIDALTALMEYEPIDAIPFLVENFGDRLTEVVDELSRQARTWKVDVGEDAAAIFTAMKQVLDIVRPGVDAITALMEYESIGRIPFLVENFGDRLTEVVNELSLQAKTWKVDVSEDAEKIFAAMTRVLAIVQPGVDAIVALMEYKPIGKIPFLVENFGDRLTEIVNELSLQAKTWKVDVSEDAQALFAAINTVVGVIRPGVDAIAALLDFVPQSNLAFRASQFAAHLLTVVEQFTLVAGSFKIKFAEEAQAWWGNVSTAIGVIRQGVDGLEALLDFVPQENLAFRASQFAAHLLTVVDQFTIVAGSFKITFSDDASAWWASVQSIVGVVEPGIKAIASLMDFTSVKNLTQKAADFAADLATVVRAIDTVAQDFITVGPDGGLSGLEAASAFATAAGKIVGFIEPAITALASLGTLAENKGLADKLKIFKQQIGQVLGVIQSIAKAFATGATGGGLTTISTEAESDGTSGLEASVIFANAVSTISTGIKGAIDLIDEFMHYKGQTIAGGLAAFQRNMLQVRNMLVFEAGEIETAVPDAERFEAAMLAIDAAITAGIDFLTGLGDVTTGGFAGIGEAIRNALAQITAAFSSETSTAASAAYAYGFTVGRGMSFGFRDGMASIPAPSFPIGPVTRPNPTMPADPGGGGTTNNFDFSGTVINSGMDAAAFEAAVTQAVRDGLRA